MVEQRAVGDVAHTVLQGFEVGQAHDLGTGVRIADNEVAKAEVIHDSLAQVNRQRLAVLVDKSAAHLPHGSLILGITAFHNDGQIRVAATQFGRQLQSRLRVLLAAALERHVADHAKHILAVGLIESHRLLIVARQHHLRAPTHAQSSLVGIERLAAEALALAQQELIDCGQDRGIEPHAIFHEQYHLQAHIQDIVSRVHLVLKQLDNGQQQIHIAKPREHIVDRTQVLAEQSPRHLAREWREDHKRRVSLALKLAQTSCRGKCRAQFHARHGDNQVITCGGECLARLVVVAHARHARR